MRKKKVAHRSESNLSSLGRPVQASACDRHLNSFPIVPADPSLYTTVESDLLTRLGSATTGLSSEQASEVLKKAGPNTVAAGGRKSMVMDLLHRCKNPLVVQLLVMCGLFYWAADDVASASIVGAMVFLSVFLSYFQESRSSRAVEKLQKGYHDMRAELGKVIVGQEAVI